MSSLLARHAVLIQRLSKLVTASSSRYGSVCLHLRWFPLWLINGTSVAVIISMVVLLICCSDVFSLKVSRQSSIVRSFALP